MCGLIISKLSIKTYHNTREDTNSHTYESDDVKKLIGVIYKNLKSRNDTPLISATTISISTTSLFYLLLLQKFH